MKIIKLTEVVACKCSCREQIGDNGKPYWFDNRKKKVYSTDCHKDNPVLAKGAFLVGKDLIKQ